MKILVYSNDEIEQHDGQSLRQGLPNIPSSATTFAPPASYPQSSQSANHTTDNAVSSGKEEYNSDDEKRNKISSTIKREDVVAYLEKTQKEFSELQDELKRSKGFEIVPMAADGNCLFRAWAYQLYGDQEMHAEVRRRCMDFMQAERDHFSQFVTEDFTHYIERKRKDRTYGNNLEIQAMSEMFNRPVEIYASKEEPINIFHGQYTTDTPPIRLSYHNGNHYNAVIDPNNPTVGVGLGLPQLEPGLADKSQVNQAMEQSESTALEEEIVQQSIQQSELEKLEQDITEQVMQSMPNSIPEDDFLDEDLLLQQAILLSQQDSKKQRQSQT